MASWYPPNSLYVDLMKSKYGKNSEEFRSAGATNPENNICHSKYRQITILTVRDILHGGSRENPAVLSDKEPARS
jgi:hypothetical protein